MNKVILILVMATFIGCAGMTDQEKLALGEKVETIAKQAAEIAIEATVPAPVDEPLKDVVYYGIGALLGLFGLKKGSDIWKNSSKGKYFSDK